MSKVMFVGDPHLTSIGPSSRKETREQYRQLLLDKLEHIRQICLNKEIGTVVFLGDMFNNNSGIINSFEADIWSKFIEFKTNNILCCTIVGNHDMAFQNETEFKGTYLFKAFLTGVIKHLNEIYIDNVTIKGVDFNKDFTKVNNLTNTGIYNICVAHSFYENERFGGLGNSNLTDEKCRELGYNAYVLGHDHVPYADVVEPTYTVIRPGSMTRGTSKTCNLYRKVQVAIFDTITYKWSYEEIPTRPGTEVFNEKVIMSKDIDLNLEKLLENFSASKGMNIYDIIDKHEEIGKTTLKEKYDEVIKTIVNYCETVGIYRKLEDNNETINN